MIHPGKVLTLLESLINDSKLFDIKDQCEIRMIETV
jgi:hypothetical protein